MLFNGATMSEEAKIVDFATKIEKLKHSVKNIPDYPKPGILFRDVSSLCQDKEAFSLSISMLYDLFKDENIDLVVAAEARGFVFGAPLANLLNSGFVMVRKPGKLPRETIEEQYDLEYGVNTLQVHKDAIQSGQRVLIIDDLLATGGTVEAMIRLCRRLGADIVGVGFIIELFDLGGALRIEREYGIKPVSLLKFPGH